MSEATRDPAYADRLADLERAWWKRFAPNPYRWRFRRLLPGRVLDVGCGLGRVLGYLDGNGVGIDHSEAAVAECRRRGLVASTPEAFASGPDAAPERFDALVCAHVLEHLDAASQDELLATYLPCVRRGGRVVLVTPQEAGQRSDPTHRTFVDVPWLRALCARHGLRVDRGDSFPLPRAAGRFFRYNEFWVVATRMG